MPNSMLLLDDEVNLCRSLSKALQRDDLRVDAFTTPSDAVEALSRNAYAVALVDLMMPGMTGLEFLREAQRLSPDTRFVIMTGYGTPETAFEAGRLGVTHYLRKPFTNDEARHHVDLALRQFQLEEENRNLRNQLADRFGMNHIVGVSRAMQDVFRVVERVANSSATVLLTGESGTGKELIARALHTESSRNTRPFIAINCGAIPSELLESELFGYEKGAFTGAHAAKKGLIEQADGGTLFLDEISELLLRLQVKMLRVLQEREVQRVGGDRVIKVDVRVIAATNADLTERIKAGDFRSDLYYRLNVVSLRIPALRERTDDILPLAHHFLRKHDASAHLKGFDALTAQILRRHSWPGNVRELENVIERACLLAKGEEITAVDLPAELHDGGDTTNQSSTAQGATLSAARDDFERYFILECLKRHNGNISRAAREAGLHRQNFYQKLHKYGIQRKDYTN